MTMFQVTKYEPCWVEWYYEVDANNAADAVEKVKAGGIDHINFEVGDNFDGHKSEYEVDTM